MVEDDGVPALGGRNSGYAPSKFKDATHVDTVDGEFGFVYFYLVNGRGVSIPFSGWLDFEDISRPIWGPPLPNT